MRERCPMPGAERVQDVGEKGETVTSVVRFPASRVSDSRSGDRQPQTLQSLDPAAVLLLPTARPMHASQQLRGRRTRIQREGSSGVVLSFSSYLHMLNSGTRDSGCHLSSHASTSDRSAEHKSRQSRRHVTVRRNEETASELNIGSY